MKHKNTLCVQTAHLNVTAGENSQQELRFTGFIDHNEAV
jgi:hypothetical protein